MKVRFGIRNVVFAKVTDVIAGVYTYATPKPLPNAVALSLDNVGDITDVKADDITACLISKDDGFGGSLEVTFIDDDFMKDIMGVDATDINDALVYDSNVLPAEFALGFEVQGTKGAKKVWLYRVIATKPNAGSATETSGRENQNQTFDLRAPGRVGDNQYMVSMELNDGATNQVPFDEFLDDVYELTLV